ncbi:adenosylcobinamide-phosphate synthase CbiB [Sphingomonas sp. dw_22]|uniref:adenosylcobinamide-phosphate synthase CbiB n=1 Tax=Sphingomonas sp. dw_22 TaxID=2721175 RepID=UPI001BD59AF3|nr:adenosylcobinamide-phosphate synthase CbiB [Sphingomonas sp. dw_22]
MAEPIALLALAVDAALGWPTALYRRIGHPVGAFARLIQVCERRWNRGSHSTAFRYAAGIATLLLLIAVAAGPGVMLHQLLRNAAGPWAWIFEALLAAPALAQRSLYDHVRPVGIALAAGDLETARPAVSRIVGRDTATLDEVGTARAAIESLAESFCDGVAAPLFWLLLLGLPGVWAYKAVNTADSLIGHREERWRAFGWAAARTDDLLNLIPARIAAALICLCGMGGWRILWRDHQLHASPNAGWPEAAMAGALGLWLGGPIAYDGVLQQKPWIGAGLRDATPGDIRRALAIYVRACLCLWIVAGTVAWAL